MVIIYDYLVGGWALPLLKNHGANRQLGWWHSQLFMEKKTSSKPPISFFLRWPAVWTHVMRTYITICSKLTVRSWQIGVGRWVSTKSWWCSGSMLIYILTL
jgi:hypothetical protein